MPASTNTDRLSPIRRAVAAVYPSTARPAAPWEAHRAPEDYGVPASPDWREIDWAALVRTTAVDGHEMTYVDLGEGDGPAIVFVHGLGGNWQNWLENLPRAAQERRAIAMDLPGFGVSPMPVEELSIRFYARLIDGLLEQLGVDSAVLVGNSMGGFIVAESAINHPERVDRIVLAAAAGISSTSRSRHPTLTMFRISGVISSAALARRHHVIARPRLRHVILSSVMRHPSWMRPDILHEIMPGSNAPGFMSALDALLDYDFTNSLPEVQAPALLIWGREDMIVPVADADEYERLLPDARKVVFDETGHVPMLERPGAFNDCLMEFVAEGAREPSARLAPPRIPHRPRWRTRAGGTGRSPASPRPPPPPAPRRERPRPPP
jgi:pimeloyl-ACP methyl ester carboxylesterase